MLHHRLGEWILLLRLDKAAPDVAYQPVDAARLLFDKAMISGASASAGSTLAALSGVRTGSISLSNVHRPAPSQGQGQLKRHPLLRTPRGLRLLRSAGLRSHRRAAGFARFCDNWLRSILAQGPYETPLEQIGRIARRSRGSGG
jgi:hypothetical protein